MKMPLAVFTAISAAASPGRVSGAIVLPEPCYAAVTVIRAEAKPYAIKRVVTTGVRRYDDAGGGSISVCTPANGKQFDAARAEVEKRVQTPAITGEIEHVIVKSTSAVIVMDHIRAIVAKAETTPGDFRAVEVVILKAPDGKELDETALPRLLKSESARASCLADNAALKQTNAPFHWAC
ncbi:MAG: hypothetical protein JWM41_4984 [Gemmatimonadetes bacterium]|nr:hypothetical protein [Gemmatimonadota bacterium]